MKEVTHYLPYGMFALSYFESLYKVCRWKGSAEVAAGIVTEDMFRLAICTFVMDYTHSSFKWVNKSIGDDSFTNENLYLVELQGLAFGYMIGRPLSCLITRKFFEIYHSKCRSDYQPAIVLQRAEFREQLRKPSERFTII